MRDGGSQEMGRKDKRTRGGEIRGDNCRKQEEMLEDEGD